MKILKQGIKYSDIYSYIWIFTHIFLSILIYLVAGDDESPLGQSECCITADPGCGGGSEHWECAKNMEFCRAGVNSGTQCTNLYRPSLWQFCYSQYNKTVISPGKFSCGIGVHANCEWNSTNHKFLVTHLKAKLLLAFIIIGLFFRSGIYSESMATFPLDCSISI